MITKPEKKRASRFFGIFGKSKKKEEEDPDQLTKTMPV